MIAKALILFAAFPAIVLPAPTELLRQQPLHDPVFKSKHPEGEEWRLAGWFDPNLGGGRMLDFTLPKLGEPINVVISGRSDPRILTHSGLHLYAKSLGFSEECLGLHNGNLHAADLGDGNGRQWEQFLARQHYFPYLGTCWESLRGGNHFRAWKQNGTYADTQAWFLGVSKEKYIGEHHIIDEDGYNAGRDMLVERALLGTHWKGMWWEADVEWKEGLLEPGSHGVNHNISQDGRTAILTVRRV